MGIFTLFATSIRPHVMSAFSPTVNLPVFLTNKTQFQSTTLTINRFHVVYALWEFYLINVSSYKLQSIRAVS